MSDVSDHEAGATPSPTGPADPAVPQHDATLFDDPLAPAATPAPAATSTPAPPAAPEPTAVPARSGVRTDVPDAAAAPAEAGGWVPPTDDDAVPSRPAPAVDTGRLFRSAGAEGPAAAAAIPALTDPQEQVAPAAPAPGTGDDPVGSVAVVAGASVAGAATAGPAAAGAATAGAAAAGPAAPTAPSADGEPEPLVVTPVAGAEDAPAESAEAPAFRGGTGLTWTGVTVVEIGVTVLLALADVLVTKDIGVITGVSLLLVSIYCALVVRPADLWAAVVTPPIAYVVALLTAGQLTYTGGSLLTRTGLGVFTDLALNAPWILAATGVSLVIVLVRRYRARRSGVLPAR